MKIKALVVDDDGIQLKLLTTFLKKLNFEGNTATNGEEAVEKMRDGEYDICFMDIQMPVMDGWEATRRLKESVDTKHIPIIAVTAHAMEGDREKIIRAGCDDYIAKPVDIEDLLDKIDNLI